MAVDETFAQNVRKATTFEQLQQAIVNIETALEMCPDNEKFLARKQYVIDLINERLQKQD